MADHMTAIAAIDLGATSGRVITGTIDDGALRMRTVTRFANNPVRLADGLHWEIAALWAAAMRGLGDASRQENVVGAAVDSWAVDYGLLRGNRLLGLPMHYRDDRNESGVAVAHRVAAAPELYRRNGLQHLAFNTLFQLVAERTSGLLDVADAALLIPDLIGWWATGVRVAERTNASTTGLLRVGTGQWDADLLHRLDLPLAVLPPVVEPGTDLGPVLPDARQEFGIADGVRFSTVGSHDTASAVAGTPLHGDDALYISCGTWSLVGVELSSPILTEDARTAGFTNEAGVDGRTRFLKNVMGLWLLSESIRHWEKVGESTDLGILLKQAAEAPADVPVFDARDPRLLAPGDMPSRIEALLIENGARVPASIPEFVRGVLQSLANAYARTIRDIEQITGRTIGVIHLVGGGAQNALLCQLTADAAGVAVIAGPVEATAVGNLLVQARTHGLLNGDLDTLRSVIDRSFSLQRFQPRTRSERS